MKLPPYKDGFLWLFKFYAMLAVVLLVTHYTAQRAADYFIMRKDVAVLPITSPPKPKIYHELPPEAVIFMSNNEVLNTKDALLNQKKEFIFVDLEAMKLSYYKEGGLEKNFKIAAKGRVGSFTETPSGVYHVQYKEKNHFSTIYNVWMPWSISFYGNYFIHGKPYYPDGTLLGGPYSGGCIRISTDDSKELFGHVDVGVPVLVFAHNAPEPPAAIMTSVSSYYQITSGWRQKLAVPSLSAQAFLAADIDTGQVLVNAHDADPYQMGGLAKLMTALVASESIQRTKSFSIETGILGALGQKSNTATVAFQAGELLNPLLLIPGDSIARLFQKEVSGFTRLMNDKAHGLGLSRTIFKSADGSGAEDVTSVTDAFKLLRYIALYKKSIFDILTRKEYSLPAEQGEATFVLENTNWSSSDKTFIGGVGGVAPAGTHVFAGIFKLQLSEFDERTIALIILGSKNKTQDVELFRTFIGKNFVYGRVVDKSTPKPRLIPAGAALYQAVQ